MFFLKNLGLNALPNSRKDILFHVFCVCKVSLVELGSNITLTIRNYCFGKINENDDSVNDNSRTSGRASNSVKAANAFLNFPLTAASHRSQTVLIELFRMYSIEKVGKQHASL